MSATERSNTVNPATDTTAPGNQSAAAAKGPSTVTAITCALVLPAAIAVLLSGCAVMENAKLVATEMTTSAPEVGPYDPQPTNAHPFIPPLVAEKPPQPPAPTPKPQPTSRAAEVRAPSPAPQVATFAPLPAPSTETKGATKLMIANDPAVVHARAADSMPAQATPTQRDTTPAATPTIAALDAAPTLIFKGPPREPRHGVSAVTIIIVVLFISGLAVAAIALLKSRGIKIKFGGATAPAKASKDKEKKLPGLEFKDPTELKDPAGHAPDTVLEA